MLLSHDLITKLARITLNFGTLQLRLVKKKKLSTEYSSSFCSESNSESFCPYQTLKRTRPLPTNVKIMNFVRDLRESHRFA